MRVVLWARRRVSRCASFCIAPNQLRAQYLKRQTRTATVIFPVFNCPSTRELAGLLDKRIVRNEIVVFFHGSIVPDRLPLAFINALSACSTKVRLEFAGYETRGHQGYVKDILTLAKTLGLAKEVDYLGPLSRFNSLMRCVKADIGLSLVPMRGGDINMTSMVGASNKPFDYLACGLALLVSDLPEWRRFYVENGYAKTCDPEQPQTIVAALEWFSTHREEVAAMGQAGRQKILAEWNYETQFRPAQEILMHDTAKRNAPTT